MGVGTENNMHICTFHISKEHIQLNLGQKCQFSEIDAENSKSVVFWFFFLVFGGKSHYKLNVFDFLLSQYFT